MTRFERDLRGDFGSYWAEQAQKELEKIKAELASGKITIDANGIARNCIGRVLMEDMQEKVAMVSDKINVQATQEAYETETHAAIEKYRAQKREISPDELYEMRAAFGSGTTVVDFLTGETIQL